MKRRPGVASGRCSLPEPHRPLEDNIMKQTSLRSVTLKTIENYRHAAEQTVEAYRASPPISACRAAKAERISCPANCVAKSSTVVTPPQAAVRVPTAQSSGVL